MKKRLFTLLFCFFVFVFPAAAQKSLNGTWEWKGRPGKNKTQDVVWLDIKQTGNKVRGGITITIYNPDEEDGSDAPVTPFVGTVQGDLVTIEFDAADTYPLDGSPLPKYVRRRTGAPNTATLKLSGGKLELTQTKGSIGRGYPRTFILTRSR